MIIKAQQKNIRISPRKVRLVANSVKHLKPSQALLQLQFAPNRAASVVAKVIKQALANASNNYGQNPDVLTFNTLEVSEGATLKRWQAVSRGRAHSILKRTCHITVALNSQDAIAKTIKPKPAKSSTQTAKPSTSKLPSAVTKIPTSPTIKPQKLAKPQTSTKQPTTHTRKSPSKASK